MNLLVTGGAGFIGSNLINLLIDRPEIDRLVNMDCLTYAGTLENVEAAAKNPKYRFKKVDIRDPDAVTSVVEKNGITHVLHLAAESHVDRSIDGPDAFVKTNVLGTLHLLDACRRHWAGRTSDRKFVQVSTDEVYGSLGPLGLFSETSPYAPSSPYAATKAAGDLLVNSYRCTHRLPVVTTHCSNNYGPYQHPEKLIPMVIRKLQSGQPVPIYGDGQQVRDWLHVDDHLAALWKVLRFGRIGETYNIGGRSESTNVQLVEKICDIVDELVLDLGGSCRRWISFVKDRPGHDRRYGVDTTKIERELGWKPAWSFDEGIRETVRWYIDHTDWVQRRLGVVEELAHR